MKGLKSYSWTAITFDGFFGYNFHVVIACGNFYHPWYCPLWISNHSHDIHVLLFFMQLMTYHTLDEPCMGSVEYGHFMKCRQVSQIQCFFLCVSPYRVITCQISRWPSHSDLDTNIGSHKVSVETTTYSQFWFLYSFRVRAIQTNFSLSPNLWWWPIDDCGGLLKLVQAWSVPRMFKIAVYPLWRSS